MIAFATQDLAIALADKAGTLRVEERATRFGDTAFFVSDEHGLIEVCLTQAEADARLAAVRRRVA